ncbi:MAG: hypothetical protein J1E29_02475, partial [Duncaniella sp.]|nr:hypothetical protein [Duncaniella sp.]
MKKIFLFLLSLMISMPALWAGEVSFYFQDGEEDDFELEYPSSFVSIWNNTADELVAVPEDMGYMPYTVDGATNLKLYPNDLDYELTVSVDGNEDMYMLEQDGNEWYLTLFGEADGLEVYVRVYLAGQAPGGNNGPAEVTMAFNVSAAGGSGIADPGSLVSISYFDRTAFVNADVAIADNYGSASVVPGTSFTISPAEGYAVTDISTYSFGVASISQPGEGDKEWYVAVDESPADSFASFFITVDKASTEEPGDDRSRDASITQIEALRWKVSWNDFDFINATDSEYDRNYATLRDEAGTVTVLHANLHGLEN